jgi:hypothetical protein
MIHLLIFNEFRVRGPMIKQTRLFLYTHMQSLGFASPLNLRIGYELEQ